MKELTAIKWCKDCIHANLKKQHCEKNDIVVTPRSSYNKCTAYKRRDENE